MVSNINICLIGETSCGKTTLASVILNKISGEIRMRGSTRNYTCFSENESSDGKQLDNVGPIPFFRSANRNYRFNVYDSAGLNCIDVCEDNIKFLEKNIFPIFDILIVVLDATKCLSTNSELVLLEKVSGIECKKIFVINKIDDIAYQEITENISIVTNFLVSKKMCAMSDIVLVGAKNLYDTIFQTENYMCLEKLYGSKENVLDIFGYHKLSQIILGYCNTNTRAIYNKKLNYVIENCKSLTDLYNIYCECRVFLKGEIGNLYTYIQKIQFNEEIFDTNIKKWIHKLDNVSLDIIFKRFCDCCKNCTIDDIHDKFGNDISVTVFLIKNMNYNLNVKLFFDILNIDGNLMNYRMNSCMEIILNKVNDVLLEHIKHISTGNDRDSYMTYLVLKTMSDKFNYTSKFSSLNKMKFVNVHNPVANNIIFEDNMDEEIMQHHLYVLCSLFFQENNKRDKIIRKLIDENFVIFPCDNMNIPLPKNWKNYDNDTSRKIYCESNKSFVDMNVGLLCGKRSQIVAFKIYDEYSLNYWKNTYNICSGTIHFKLNDVFYYLFVLGDAVSDFRFFDTTDGKKINIEFISDSYIPLTTEFLEHIDNSGSMRDKINYIPDQLGSMIRENNEKTKRKEEYKKNIMQKSRNDFCYIAEIPEDILDQELCDLAVSENVASIFRVPDKFKSIDLCRKALKEWHRDIFRDTDDNTDIIEMCKTAISRYAGSLCFVPNKLKTMELCELAINQNGLALIHVPENIQTKELCELAVKRDGCALEYVSGRLQTKELCELAVKQAGYALRCVPDNFKTKELCETAVRDSGCALKYVPEKLKTKELCETAIRDDRSAFEFVPETLRTKELCELAVNKTGYALKYVPENPQTKELCEPAVKRNKCYTGHVSESLKAKKLCELAVKKNGHNLRHVPNNFKTKELCELAVRSSGCALEFVPENFKTKQLCESAVRNHGCALRSVPNNFKTKELCDLAISKSGYALMYVPENLKTEELCEFAVKRDGRALEFVPEIFRTKKLCESAAKQNSLVLKHVLKYLKTKERY